MRQDSERAAVPRAHGMEGGLGAMRPARVTDTLTDRVSATAQDLADRILAADLAGDTRARSAAWSQVTPDVWNEVTSLVTGYPAVAAAYAYPSTDSHGRAVVSLDSLLADGLDALCAPVWDAHGRPGVTVPRSVSALLWDAWQDVAPTVPDETRAIVSAWLTLPRAERAGRVSPTVIARALGLCPLDTRVAPVATRATVTGEITHAVRLVEDRAAQMMSEGHAERVTRARVPIVWHETPRAARATVTLTAHGTRRWSQCDRDKNGHPVTGGRTWHGTRPVTVTREITVARPLTLTTSARERARVIGAQTVCRVIPATAIGTVGGVRVPRRKRVSRDRLTRGQVLADAYRRDYAASWRDLRPRARDLRQGYPWVIDPTGERLRLTDEARATLYGPDALASQDRLRARVAYVPDAPRAWHAVTGADRHAVTPLVARNGAPVGHGRGLLRAAFGPRA